MADTSCKKDISEGVGVRDKSAMAPGHCICGASSVDSSSMIECCVCLNHFHGDCVGISRQKATMLKHFYCPLCMDNNPQLVTQFENKAERGEESERGARLCEREFEAGMMERVSRRKGMKRRMLKSRKSNRTYEFTLDIGTVYETCGERYILLPTLSLSLSLCLLCVSIGVELALLV